MWRMRCSAGKLGCGRRFRLRRPPHRHTRTVRCPHCRSVHVRSVEKASPRADETPKDERADLRLSELSVPARQRVYAFLLGAPAFAASLFGRRMASLHGCTGNAPRQSWLRRYGQSRMSLFGGKRRKKIGPVENEAEAINKHLIRFGYYSTRSSVARSPRPTKPWFARPVTPTGAPGGGR